MNKVVLNISLITLLLLICSSVSYGQNVTDSLGRKQGVWKYYSGRNKLIAKGQYSNDKKIGRWEYYTDGGDFYSHSNTYEYHEDGSITIWRLKNYYYINKDSSYISFNRDSSYKQIECTRSATGEYNCIRYHEKGDIQNKTTFPNFGEAWLRLETKWR